MKKYIIHVILFSVIFFICFNIFFNAKQHVDTVKVVDELVVESDSLKSEVKILNIVKDSVMEKIELLDSTICSKDSLIVRQRVDLKTLKLDTARLKKVSTIIIRDTVYITETKNFWGRKRKTIETASSTDSLQLELNENDTTTLDTTKFN